MLSERISQITPSQTLQITAKAKKLKKQGVKVINFAAGEPDFDTPELIKNYAMESIRRGETKYTPASGLIELKEAIVEKFRNENNLEYSVENIIVSCGAKHSIYNALFALLNPGDEVIIFSPYWVTYPEQVKLCGAVPVYVDTSQNDFHIPIDTLKEKINEKTKAIILNSPQNPTGVAYTKDEIKQIAEIVLSHKNLYVISDEIYEKIIFDNNEHISIASFGDDIKERTIVINGMSKAYAMTGWRIGFLAAPAPIAKAISSFQSHTTSNPTTFCQTASIFALRNIKEEIKEMQKIFENRRNLIYNLLSEIPNIKVNKPGGAFYIFPDVSAYYGKKYKDKQINGSVDFASILLDEKKVALVPGIAFGNDRFVRISFATSEEDIKTGVQLLKEFLSELS